MDWDELGRTVTGRLTLIGADGTGHYSSSDLLSDRAGPPPAGSVASRFYG